MSDRDYYKILQVDPEADLDVIRAAHRVLRARLHPEHDLTGVEEVRLTELDRALAVLSDPFRRVAYNQERELTMVAVGPGPSDDQAGGRADGEHTHLAMGALTERIQAGQHGQNVSKSSWTLADMPAGPWASSHDRMPTTFAGWHATHRASATGRRSCGSWPRSPETAFP